MGNQFYNPKLFKPAPKVELSSEERILVSQGGTASPTPAPGGIAGTGVAVMAEVSAHNQVDPGPSPETWGAYAKKSGESTGVIAMIDLLIKDLTKEMTEAKTTENDAQADYEQMMRDSAERRTLPRSTTRKRQPQANWQPRWSTSRPSTPNAIGCSSTSMFERKLGMERLTRSSRRRRFSTVRIIRCCNGRLAT